MNRIASSIGLVLAAALIYGVAALLPAAAQLSPPDQQSYMLIDLHMRVVQGINDDGLIAGQVMQPNGAQQMAIWQGGDVTVPGTFGGRESILDRFDKQGHVFGYAATPEHMTGSSDPNFQVDHSFIYDSATRTMFDLSTEAGRKQFQDSPQSKTVQMIVQTRTGPVLFDGGKIVDVGLPKDKTSALAYFNRQREFVGYTSANGSSTHAVYLANGTLTDISPPLTAKSAAVAINEDGMVAANSAPSVVSGWTSPYLWKNGSITSLPPLPGGAAAVMALNDAGAAVGTSTYGNITEAAVLWQNGRVVDLNTRGQNRQGWVLSRAVGINNYGWIVGDGLLNGNGEAFLLIPLAARALSTTPAPTVPSGT